MKLPGFRRLNTSDYPKEFKKLIDIISVSLNNGIEVLYEALDNRITLRDNFSGTVKDITVTVDASGTPTQGGAFVLDTNSKVDGITVLSAANQVNPAVYPTSQPFISGAQNNLTFNISNISGLQANQSYVLRIQAWQG